MSHSPTTQSDGHLGSRPSSVEGHRVPPTAIPDHELLRCIGSGSYGEVWLARNLTGSYRAVKIIHRSAFKDEKPFEREFNGICKFEPISRLHEGFVDVLHVGKDEAHACFYYVMELADDQSSGQEINPQTYAPKTIASEVARAGSLSLRETVRLGLALTETLSKLHEHGLVHRDIKPSNIIFVHGSPKLADIGLVTEAARGDAQSWVGTAGFIPPEGPGSVKADIYSLGKVLYEASTGKDRQEFPALPTLLESSPDHEGLLELNEIVIRACHHDPLQRYGTAWEMHAELTAIANGKSLRRLRLLERRWASLKKAVTFAGILALVASVLLYEVYREWRARLDQHEQKVGSSLAYGNNAMEQGDFLGALPYFAEVLRLEEGRRNEPMHRLRLGSLLALCPRLTHAWAESNYVNSGCFSPDGTRVLVAELYGKAKIYDVDTGRLSAPAFGSASGLSMAAYSADGKWIVTASEDKTAELWDATSLQQLQLWEHPDRVYSAGFTRDGLQVVTCGKDGKLRFWDTQTGQLRSTLDAEAPIGYAAFSHKGNLVVSCARDGTARLFDSGSGEMKLPPLKHGIWVTYACFSPDDTKLLTASDDRRVCVWDVPSGRRLLPDLVHKDMVTTVAYSPDGRLILTASLDGTVRLWLANNLQPLPGLPVLKHGERVSYAAFSPDSRRVLVCCANGSVRVWDLSAASLPAPVANKYNSTATCYTVTNGNQFEIRDALTGTALSPPMPLLDEVLPELASDGRFAFCARPQQQGNATNVLVHIWESRTGRRFSRSLPMSPASQVAALSHDGRLLLTFGGKQVQIWEMDREEPAAKTLKHNSTVTSAMFTRDGKRVLTASGTNVHFWSSLTGSNLLQALSHSTSVNHVELSHDEALLVTVCSNDQLTKCYAQVWDAQTARPLGPHLRHTDGVLWASFSPDGKRVVTAGEDFRAIVWETATGKQLGSPLKHEHRIQSACFSPDGQWILTASDDRTARIWNAQTMEPLTPPLRHCRPVFGGSFLPNSRGIITTSRGQTWLWRFPNVAATANEMLNLAQLLSEGTASEGRSFEDNWLLFRDKCFNAPDTHQIASWHEFQAQDCEREQDWLAALFHLRRLQNLDPADTAVPGRIARAEQHLAR